MLETHPTNQFTIEESLMQACNLVARDDTVSAVYLITPTRPTLLEISTGVELARERHVAFSVTPTGALIMREEATETPSSPRWQRPHPHLPKWQLGLPNLEEGIR